MNKQNPGVVFAVEISGDGHGDELRWEQFQERWSQPGLIWLNAAPKGEEANEWLRNESGASPSQSDYLLAEQTRPG